MFNFCFIGASGAVVVMERRRRLARRLIVIRNSFRCQHPLESRKSINLYGASTVEHQHPERATCTI